MDKIKLKKSSSINSSNHPNHNYNNKLNNASTTSASASASASAAESTYDTKIKNDEYTNNYDSNCTNSNSNNNNNNKLIKTKFTNENLSASISFNNNTSTNKNTNNTSTKHINFSDKITNNVSNSKTSTSKYDENIKSSNKKQPSNRYQTIDFDYLTERLKQIENMNSNTTSTSNNNENNLNKQQLAPKNPTQSSTNPTLKSSIKSKKNSLDSTNSNDIYLDENKKIYFKLNSNKKEIQRCFSHMDQHRPLKDSLKQKLSLSLAKSRANCMNGNKLTHYNSQPIYEDQYDEYTNSRYDDDDDDNEDLDEYNEELFQKSENYDAHKKSKLNSYAKQFNGKHVPNRSVSNMSYTQNHNQNLYNSIDKKSKSAHLSQVTVYSTSQTETSSSTTASSSTTSSRSSSSAFNKNSQKYSNSKKTPSKKLDEHSSLAKTTRKPRSPKMEKAQNQEVRIQRRSSVTNLTPTPSRSIVIRREKSIASHPSMSSSNTNPISDGQAKHNESLKISLTNSTQLDDELIKKKKHEHLLLKQTLLASLNSKESSSTTSGVESSSKNSTSNCNHDGNDDCKLSTDNNNSNLNDSVSNNNNTIANINTNDSSSSNTNNSYIIKINELKNSLFVLEIELKNEKKKLSIEKDLKSKLVSELKSRFQTEKEAALKAQEAKLNAEKLYELNKLRETIEIENREEYDQNQKSFDSELINLQLKLREKAEKCLQLEKLLKEEHNKNTRLYMKSMEVVRKYNDELRHLKDAASKTNTKKLMESNPIRFNPNTSSIQTQTDTLSKAKSATSIMNSLDELKFDPKSITDSSLYENSARFRNDLINIKKLLNSGLESKNESSLTTQGLLNEIETLVKMQNKTMSNLRIDNLAVNDKHTKLINEMKSLKEAKTKLESLYKIKCKSDLNKSAQIKKLELNYEYELMKFRNEFNCDLVAYLQNKLTVKESLLNENYFQLNNLLSLINKHLNNPTTANGTSSQVSSSSSTTSASSLANECLNIKNVELNKLKELIENLLNAASSGSPSSSNVYLLNNLQNENLTLNLNNIYKKNPVNLLQSNSQTHSSLFKSKNSKELSLVPLNQTKKERISSKSETRRYSNTTDKDQSELTTESLKIQEELNKIDKHLNDMKSLNTNLMKGKSENKSEASSKSTNFSSPKKFTISLNNNKSSSDNNNNKAEQTTTSIINNSHSLLDIDEISNAAVSLKLDSFEINNSNNNNNKLNDVDDIYSSTKLIKSNSLNSLNMKKFNLITEFVLSDDKLSINNNSNSNINKTSTINTSSNHNPPHHHHHHYRKYDLNEFMNLGDKSKLIVDKLINSNKNLNDNESLNSIVLA